MATAPKTENTTLKYLTLILGVVLYVGALLLGWLASAPEEVVEPMKGLAYALALGTPMLLSKSAAKKGSA